MRVFLTLDETNPLKPVPCLHVNGKELRLTETELHGLFGECSWCVGHLNDARKVYFKDLARTY